METKKNYTPILIGLGIGLLIGLIGVGITHVLTVSLANKKLLAIKQEMQTENQKTFEGLKAKVIALQELQAKQQEELKPE